VVRYHQTDLVVEGAVSDQVVVGSNLGKGADRKGRRLGRSLDSLLRILVLSEDIELPLGGDEIFVALDLDRKITEVVCRDVVVRTDESSLAVFRFVVCFPVLASSDGFF